MAVRRRRVNSDRRRRMELTRQDWDIWLFKLGAHSLYSPLYEVSVLQDRRDADLMLTLVSARTMWRGLFREFGPRACADGWDQVGEGPDAVPMPQLPFNL